MRIAITGASGLVAKGVILEALEHTTHDLRLIDVRQPSEKVGESRVEYVQADLRSYDAFYDALAGMDALVHLAVGAPRGVPPQDIHNIMVVMSYNALQAAASHGMRYVALASSINAIGALLSNDPKFDYFPLNEKHPYRPEDAYSLGKHILEIQADAFARKYPDMSISCLRFHFISFTRPNHENRVESERKDVWAWTDVRAAGRACMLALEVDWVGSEIFYIVAPEHCAGAHSALELAARFYPETKVASSMTSTSGFYDCSKAKRMLGWEHDGGRMPGKADAA